MLVGCPKKNKPPPVERVWLGDTVACALLVTGELRCQGSNAKAQLGPAVPAFPHGPVTVPVTGKVLRVEHHPTSFCVAIEGQPSLCQGVLAVQDLNMPTGCRVDRSAPSHAVECLGPRWPNPVRYERLGAVAELAEGRAHACARLESGTVVCWGENERGQLATPARRGSQAAAPVQGVYGATSIVVAGDGTCVVLKDKSVRCWGDNTDERLSVGHGPILDVPTPVHF